MRTGLRQAQPEGKMGSARGETGARPERRVGVRYSNGGVPTLSRQIRVRVGCAAQSDGAPAMSGLAAGAKRIVNMLIAPV